MSAPGSCAWSLSSSVGEQQRLEVQRVEPLERHVTYRSVKAREVVDHWTHAAAGRDERPPDAQLAFDGL